MVEVEEGFRICGWLGGCCVPQIQPTGGEDAFIRPVKCTQVKAPADTDMIIAYIHVNHHEIPWAYRAYVGQASWA